MDSTWDVPSNDVSDKMCMASFNEVIDENLSEKLKRVFLETPFWTWPTLVLTAQLIV